MTLSRFVVRNLWRNKRRTVLTVLSLGFSFLLLTFMASIWRSFYYESWTRGSALRLVCRHRVSFFAAMPSSYREKIRAVPGVVGVAPMNHFHGLYKDQGEGFGQIGTDPSEFLQVYDDYEIPGEQVKAWQQDPAGAVADRELARTMGWKLGDKIFLRGQRFPTDLELTLRGTVKGSFPAGVIYFNWKYVQEAAHYDKAEVLLLKADSPEHVGRISRQVDELFHNSTAPTRAESEHAFDLDMVATLGNVKAFILSICGAVLFTSLLVAANTIAMSIRERTREVAVLRTLGFAPETIMALFVGESAALCLGAWLLATLAAYGLIYAIAHSAQGVIFAVFVKINLSTVILPLLVAILVGGASAVVPSRRASRMNIVEALRYVG
ncbi:MAG: FtsX-like permease family protein [Acidobacteriia bacterium]|nr:FtsX-like permease family protein [Terriglobia bacterium]